jgi:hypothetical protein
MTIQFIMPSRPQTHGTNPNTTIALKDITGLALKKERRYSKAPIPGQVLDCTTVSVDGTDITLEELLDIISGFETL